MPHFSRIRSAVPMVITLVRALTPTAHAGESAADGAASGQTVSNQTTYGRDWFAVLPGYAQPSRDYPTTGSGFTMSGIYGHQFSAHWAAELNIQGSVFETGLNRGSDFYQNGGTLDLVYQFRDRREALWTPFLVAGVGGVYDDLWPRNRVGGALLADVGGGVVTQPLFSTGIRFRFDARYNYDGHEGGYRNVRYLAGIEIPLGRTEHRVEREIETREVVRETPVHTPAPTPAPVAASQVIELRGVSFEFNQARLTLDARTVLDLMARRFAQQPALRVEVAGFTDSTGSAAINLKLSQSRAEAVRDYLIGRGVKPGQLVARGYGKAQPLVSPERGAADRERNRRVELRVTSN